MRDRGHHDALVRIMQYACLAIVVIIYAYVTYRISSRLALHPMSDMNAHARSVAEIWLNASNGGFERFFSETSYPGWHALVAIFLVCGLSVAQAAGVACALFACLTALIVWYVARIIIGEHAGWLALGIMVVLLFVTAIYLPWYSDSVYMGQGSPTVWHNPTYDAVKPFALAASAVLFCMIRDRSASVGSYVAFALITLLCLMLKPSFFQVQAPAVFLYLLVDVCVNRDWRFVRNVALSFVPAIFYMAVPLWIMLFSSSGGGEGIGLCFFQVYGAYNSNVLVSILLLLAFPLFATIVLRKEIFSTTSPYLFLFLMLVIGFCEYSFVMENGERMYHGNFAWGYYLAVFLYWAFVLPLFAKRAFVDGRLSRWMVVIGCMLVVAHLLSGVIYCSQFLFDASGEMLY